MFLLTPLTSIFFWSMFSLIKVMGLVKYKLRLGTLLVATTGKVVIICFLPKYGYFDALGNVASVKEKKL